MAVEDYMESEVAVAVAATAAAFSPRARHLARRGLVYGIAGVMKAADAVTSAAGGMAQGAQSAMGHDGGQVKEQPAPARAATRAPRQPARAGTKA